MGTTTTTIYADLARIIGTDQPDTSWTAEELEGATSASSGQEYALVRFSYPSGVGYRPISAIKINCFCSPRVWPNEYAQAFSGNMDVLAGSFDAGVTYNTRPNLLKSAELYGYTTARYVSSGAFGKADAANIIKNGLQFFALRGSLSTSLSQNPIFLELTHSDADDYGSVSGSPRSGYASKTGRTTFRWSFSPPSNILGELSVSGCRFAYRKGTTGSFTFVDCGTSLQYTSTAGMFSDTDTVQWYPEITLNNGTVLVPKNSSGVAYNYTLTTIEPTFTAVAVSPDDSYEDGSEPITFAWTASNSAGTQPSGADLQYSTDGGTTWTDMASVTGSARIYSAAANSLPSGQLSWRVRAINSESVAGAWSDPLSFINVSAPAAPSVNTDTAPFTTITWDALGQQASEVVIDGVSYGVRFGAGKSFTLPQPLADGLHTAEVRIQGAYGLWSQFGSTAFTVANAAAGTIDLVGIFDVDAQLQWAADVSGSDFQIYRDGVQIGHTSASSFADRRALGTHTWFVLLRQEDGNYTKSNEVTGTLTSEAPVIAPLAGGSWIHLRLTESSTTQQAFSYARTHTLRHYSGSPYPVIELTPYEDVSWSYQCAFADADEARSFEALRGQIVILKAYGMVLIGGMMNLSKGRNPFYLAYQFTIEQIAVEEIVDDPNA